MGGGGVKEALHLVVDLVNLYGTIIVIIMIIIINR